MHPRSPLSLNGELCRIFDQKALELATQCTDMDAKPFLLFIAKAYEHLAKLQTSLERDRELIAKSRKLLSERI
jgi:hypothetical protein